MPIGMIELVIKLAFFLFPLAYSPGPGNLFFAANGARFGFKATLGLSAGYHLATLGVTLAIGLGFGWVTQQVPQFMLVVKYAGSLYVAWLAWRLLRAGTIKQHTQAKPANFMDGVALLLLNPKAYVIIVLLFSQFTPSAGEATFLYVGVISLIFTLNNLLAFSVWTLAGNWLGTLFRRDASAARLNLFFGVMLGVVAVWMALP